MGLVGLQQHRAERRWREQGFEPSVPRLPIPGAPFTWTKAGLEIEIGFRDFKHLAANFSPSRQHSNCRDDRICHQGECPTSGRKRDSLITVETSLIAI
jgi:hypothetical protein